MKKVALLLAFLLCVFPITANAATPRIVGIVPSISFSGNIANCSVSITADSFNDDIDAIVKLWNGSSCIATWTTTGNGFVNFSETKNISKGKTYKLTVDVTINDVAKPTVSVTGTCK